MSQVKQSEMQLVVIFLHPFSLLLLFLFLLLPIFRWLSPNHSTLNQNLPPSPRRLPIIGNLHQLGMYPYRSLQTLSQSYGDLMLLHLGSKPTLVVSSAQVASQVLKTHDLIFASRPDHLRVFKRILANGKDMLSSPYGEYWRQMRTMWVQHLMGAKPARFFRCVREEELALMMESIQSCAPSMVNLSEMFTSLTNDVVCRLAFGKKCIGEKQNGVEFKELLGDVFNLLGGFHIGGFISWLGWIDQINGVDGKASEVARALDDFLDKILQEHSTSKKERNFREGEDDQHINDRDLLDVLLREVQRDDPSGSSCLDRESVKGLILDIFAAGTVTLSAALEWMMSELLRDSRIMKELKKELRDIVEDKEVVTEDDLKNTKYLKAVIKETLRLHPSAPLTPLHLSMEDVKINGYDISKGTLLLVNLWAIGRDPAYWEEPESFYPERFLDSPIDLKGRDFHLIPFGSGRRICLGMAFALANLELVIANLVHQFDWALPNWTGEESSLDMTEAPTLVVRRKTPLVAIPTPRIG